MKERYTKIHFSTLVVLAQKQKNSFVYTALRILLSWYKLVLIQDEPKKCRPLIKPDSSHTVPFGWPLSAAETCRLSLAKLSLPRKKMTFCARLCPSESDCLTITVDRCGWVDNRNSLYQAVGTTIASWRKSLMCSCIFSQSAACLCAMKQIQLEAAIDKMDCWDTHSTYAAPSVKKGHTWKSACKSTWKLACHQQAVAS